MEKRPVFRWHVKHDLDLAREVVATRPKSGADWNELAARLEGAWPDQQGKGLKGRSCKEHFDVMLAHHKQGNAAALRKSGTEEEYTEIAQLMEDAQAYFDDFKKEKSEMKNVKKAKEDLDKEKGLAFRDAAMKTLRRKSFGYDSSDSSDEDSSYQTPSTGSKRKDSPVPRKKKAKSGATRPDVMTYLMEKNQSMSEYRDKELKYKHDALEVEKRKVEVQEKQMQMQLEMMKAFASSKKDN